VRRRRLWRVQEDMVFTAVTFLERQVGGFKDCTSWMGVYIETIRSMLLSLYLDKAVSCF